VEAARAGEAGKGFAVVAEEVRNLAMRSADAARSTATLIEGSVENAMAGVTIAGEVAQVLTEITGASDKVSHLVSQIAAASHEQSQGIVQVNQAVQQMDKLTQGTAAIAEESAASAEELNSQGEQVRAVVDELRRLVEGATAPMARRHASNQNEPRGKQPLGDHSRRMVGLGTTPQPREPEEDFSDFKAAA
jgi:methyl-accepting chemotaxis protein